MTTRDPAFPATARIPAATKDLQNEAPLFLLDGFNIDVKPTDGIALTRNAQPSQWPPTHIVPD